MDSQTLIVKDEAQKNDRETSRKTGASLVSKNGETFKKLRESLEDFDVSKVRYDEIQRSAIMMAPAAAD